MAQRNDAGPFASGDPDTLWVWWTGVGIPQNLTFAVHLDPVSGGRCRHRAVHPHGAGAEPGERRGDISLDVGRADAAYRLPTRRRQMAGGMRQTSGTSTVADAQASAVGARPAELIRALAFLAGEPRGGRTAMCEAVRPGGPADAGTCPEPLGEPAPEGGSAEVPEEAR